MLTVSAAPKLLTRDRFREQREPEKGSEDTEEPKPVHDNETSDQSAPGDARSNLGRRITIDPSANHPREDSTLYIPGPRDRDHGECNSCKSLACRG